MKKLIDKIKNSKKLQIITCVIILILAFIIYSLVTAPMNSLGQKAANKAEYVTNNSLDAIDDDIYDSGETYREEYGEDAEVYNDKSGVADSENYEYDKFVSAEDKNQKLVYSGDVNIYTDNVDKTYNELSEKMKAVNAKIEYLNEYNDTKEMSVRVSHDKFMEFYESLKDISGDITNSNLNIDDKTKEYVSNERKIDVLQSEYDELKELLKEAKNVKEVLTIKDRMSELQYNLDSLTQHNNDIDYDVDYSRIQITIEKSSTFSKIPYYKQMRDAFLDSFYVIGEFFLFLIRIWWVILAVLIIIYRRKIFKKLKCNKSFDLTKKDKE